MTKYDKHWTRNHKTAMILCLLWIVTVRKMMITRIVSICNKIFLIVNIIDIVEILKQYFTHAGSCSRQDPQP